MKCQKLLICLLLLLLVTLTALACSQAPSTSEHTATQAVTTPDTVSNSTELSTTEGTETQTDTQASVAETLITEVPETQALETEAPETEAPQTEAPETEAPETEAPETEAPETEAPETEAPETEAPETVSPVHAEAATFLDFVVEVETGRDIRVLQLTDTQIIDSSQKRTEDRLDAASTAAWAPGKMDSVCFQYIRKAIERVQPDLILITGDLVYGQFDDAGTSLQALIAEMDSYKIPWAPVFGNHDNESKKGANWQCEQLENSPYCLFKRGDTDGNGNYTVGVMQGGELIRVFYMMDSNGCKSASSATENHVTKTAGFTQNQVKWLNDRMTALDNIMGDIEVKASVCFHIPTQDYVRANQKYLDQKSSFTIHKEVTGPATDFGSLRESGGIKGAYEVTKLGELSFIDILKAHNVDSTFAAHSHQVNTSVMYEGIRWTMGLKTGTYDRYTAQELGGTQITFNKDELKVKHVYANTIFQDKMDALIPQS